MRTRWVGVSTFMAVAALACSGTLAAPFEPLVVAGVSTGGCFVVTPDATAPVPVQSGRAYHYGSTFSTVPGVPLPVILSVGNECLMGGGSEIRTAEDAQDKTKKLITLLNGKLDVALNPDYSEMNTLDVASECVRASFTKGGKASFENINEGELRVFVVNCVDSHLAISGPQFTIPQIKKGDVLSGACAPDMSYIRIRNVEGTFTMKIRDAEGADKDVPMEKGAVVKILQKRSDVENTVVVTILLVGTDDTVTQAITYSVKVDSAPAAPQPTAASAKEEQPPTVASAEEEKPKEWEPMWATVAPATTTTTTTVPRADILAAAAYRRSLIPTVVRPDEWTTTTTTRPPPTPVGRR